MSSLVVIPLQEMVEKMVMIYEGDFGQAGSSNVSAGMKKGFQKLSKVRRVEIDLIYS